MISGATVFVLAVLAATASGFVSKTMKCEYYNVTCVMEAKALSVPSSHCQEKERVCTNPTDICYVVWRNSTTESDHKSGHDVQLMGCMPSNNDHECFDDEVCQGQPSNNHYVCCCKDSLCNANFKFAPRPVPVEVPTTTTVPPPASQKKSVIQLLYGLPIVVITVVVGTVSYEAHQMPIKQLELLLFPQGIYVWKRKKSFEAVPNLEDGDDGTPMSGRNGDGELGQSLAARLPQDATVELKEIKAQGRFGEVWKGRLRDQTIAVKILTEKSSWITEKEIYNLPRMNCHDNILQFLYVDYRTHDHNFGRSQEFWLITEFHDRGSLCDFLKGNLISWEDLCKIALSIGQGLTFLHEEKQASGRFDTKPAIAHRDFKSKNVLIKNDMTACIADFGLALVFEPGKTCGDNHGQVRVFS